MTKLKLPPKITKFFDNEEKELIESIENGNYIPLPQKEQEEIKAMLKQAAENTIALRKQINIRLNPTDIKQIKSKAAAAGIPYQTLINTLIHQYATGKITLTL